MSSDGSRYVATKPSESKNGPRNACLLELVLVDCLSGQEVRRIDPYPGQNLVFALDSIQFSPNGHRFVHRSQTPDASGRTVKWGFKVWDWSTGREVFAHSDFTGVITMPAFDSSATRLATGTSRPRVEGGGDLIIWDIDGGKQLLTIPVPDCRFVSSYSITFSPDGTRIAALLRPAGPYTADAPLEIRRLGRPPRERSCSAMARDPGRPPWPTVPMGEPWRSLATAGRCIGSGMPARARRSSNSP